VAKHVPPLSQYIQQSIQSINLFTNIKAAQYDTSPKTDIKKQFANFKSSGNFAKYGMLKSWPAGPGTEKMIRLNKISL